MIAYLLAGLLAPLALWRFWPLGKSRDIIGQTAYVGSNGLGKSQHGEVTWSGTIMKARLDKNAAADRLEAGAQVHITGTSGRMLVVAPKEG